MRRAHGTLLSGRHLEAALPGRIFRPGTWVPDNIKGAGYELRLAGDFLVVPTTPGASTFKTIKRGDPPVGDFTLKPGDSALISTEEKFCMDFDISGLVGPKFRWSAQGLLVMHGMVAHPGYGRELKANGKWAAKDDERLYLIVANIGPTEIHLRRGDKIAYMQFFEVDPVVKPRAIDNVGFDHLTQHLFGQDSAGANAGLAYFKNVRDLKDSVEAERIQVHARLDALTSTLDRARSSAETVVVFGVFLVAATLLGVVANVLISTLTSLPSDLTSTRALTALGIAVLYAVTTVISVVIVAKSVGREIKNPPTPDSRPPK